MDVVGIVNCIGRSAAETDNFVGLSIGFSMGDSLLYTAGFGVADVELNVPATANTVYRIESITKEFTAAAVMLLVEDGEVQLDDCNAKPLPWTLQTGSRPVS